MMEQLKLMCLADPLKFFEIPIIYITSLTFSSKIIPLACVIRVVEIPS